MMLCLHGCQGYAGYVYTVVNVCKSAIFFKSLHFGPFTLKHNPGVKLKQEQKSEKRQSSVNDRCHI